MSGESHHDSGKPLARTETKSPVSQLLENHPELAEIHRNRSGKTIIVADDSGEIIRSGHTYHDIPRMRELVELGDAIRESLPPVPREHMRLWRGNRPNEVGHNPSYTNSLEGIALPFLRAYRGVLSYVDVPEKDVWGFLSGGAKNSEFVLSHEFMTHVHVVGFTEDQAREILEQAQPLQDSAEEDSGRDKWSMV